MDMRPDRRPYDSVVDGLRHACGSEERSVTDLVELDLRRALRAVQPPVRDEVDGRLLPPRSLRTFLA